MMKFAILVFPGSNCDHDAYKIIENIEGANPKFVWHRENNLSPYDAELSGSSQTLKNKMMIMDIKCLIFKILWKIQWLVLQLKKWTGLVFEEYPHLFHQH